MRNHCFLSPRSKPPERIQSSDYICSSYSALGARAGLAWWLMLAESADCDLQTLSPALVKNIELIPRIRRKELSDLFQARSQRRGCQQRIFALTQFVIIHVQAEREQVDGYRIRKR